MKHFFKLLILFVVSASFGYYYTTEESISKNQIENKKSPSSKSSTTINGKDGEFLKDVISRVKQDYVEEKSDKELVEAAANGIMSSLDPHSSYLNEDEFKEMQVQTKGEFGGLGIEIIMEYSLVKVVAAIDDTPAQKAGIKAGDYISRVDGKSISGLTIEEIVKKLRGKPGTKVAITVLRKGEKEPIEMVIYRQIIHVKAVKAEAKSDVAYIKIRTFSAQAHSGLVSEIKKLVNEIGKNKIRGLVLDLRNNPGGLLDQAIKVSDTFLDKKMTIVSIKGRNTENTIYEDDADQNLIPGVPIVVLINEGSASASEIVAGALQDNKRAIILGTKSFGKGSVQSVIDLGDSRGALKMTTSLYYTPSGKSIQAHGIEPDIIVNEAKLDLTSEDKNNIRSESSLNGHLKSQIEGAIKEGSKKDQLKDDIELYNEDYQLARAIDLLRGISVYSKLKK